MPSDKPCQDHFIGNQIISNLFQSSSVDSHSTVSASMVWSEHEEGGTYPIHILIRNLFEGSSYHIWTRLNSHTKQIHKHADKWTKRLPFSASHAFHLAFPVKSNMPGKAGETKCVWIHLPDKIIVFCPGSEQTTPFWGNQQTKVCSWRLFHCAAWTEICTQRYSIDRI